MTKPLTEMADNALTDAMSVQRCDDDLIHAVERIAEVVRQVAVKIEGEQPAPDVLGRVLELAKSRADELMKTAGEFTYSGLADYYRYGADCLYDFAATLRKEFNRE